MFKFLVRINIILSISLFLTAISACASSIEFGYRRVDPALQTYVKDYLNLVHYHCPKFVPTSRYTIVLRNKLDDPKWAGVCDRKINGFTIEIRRKYWELYTPIEQRQLMYHELSHCFIQKDHVPRDENNINYMNPVLEYIPYEIYIKQTIDDIEAYCKVLK